MSSLSYLTKEKNINFIYYTRELSSYLRDSPSGNLKFALKNGMNLIEIRYDIFKHFILSLKSDENTLLIKQGALQDEAREGIEILANELNDFVHINNNKRYKIFLPSGTGATALYLQSKSNIDVYTVSCVGDDKYLKEQFLSVEPNENLHPTILKAPKKYHFAKVYIELYNIYKELLNTTGIEFELIYDSIGWLTILKYQNLFCENTIYIHQGGLVGNESQLLRYHYKFNMII